VEDLVVNIGTWIETVGPLGYVLAPLLMVTVAILPFPAEFPAMVNGMMFGPWVGTLVTWGGAVVGAMISFELSRRLGRPLAERFVPPAALARVDRAVERADWWGLLLPRFIPVIAFTALNWGAGLTPVSRWRFAWTTALGILPGAIVFTAGGAGLPLLVERFPTLMWTVAGLLVAYGGWRLYRSARPAAHLPPAGEAQAAVPGGAGPGTAASGPGEGRGHQAMP